MCVPPGAWETKVSNREKKKQQRRKDKGPEDSGWVEAPRSHQEAPAGPVSAGTKRNRNHGIHPPNVQLLDWEHFAVLLSDKKRLK